jgi:hypothetical protein
MTKITLLALFLLFGSAMNSQIAFYLRPTVNMKTNQGNIWGNLMTHPVYSTMTNEYFSIHTGKMYFDDNQIDLGLNLGLKYKNKHYFEIGISTDHSGIQTQASFIPWGIDHYNSNLPIVKTGGHHNQSEIGNPFTRISFTYNNLIWKNDANTIQLRGLFGIGSMYNHYVNRKKNIYVVYEIPAFTLVKLTPIFSILNILLLLQVLGEIPCF